MGPFVPDIISNELNLVVALLLGVAFGAVLEQAGFSSSRKLAGVFYGYDFTVLRVFFTAGITAMSGVLILGALGVLDTGAIFVNPTFLGPAIVGGAIMGVGFILGGYCPGTSICAAAIGKKDGIAFVIGGVIGVFVFGELFPLYDGFYLSGALGPLQVFTSLGVSAGTFALGLIVIAVGAFIVTTRIEKKVDASSPAHSFPVRRHVAAGAVLVALGVVLFFLPDRKVSMLEEIAETSYQQQHPVPTMSADELAFRIVDRDPLLLVIDVRPAAQFQAMTLPGAVNIPVDGLFGKEWAATLGMRHKKRVFIDDDGTAARTAALLAGRLGYNNISTLEGGLNGFRATILSPQSATALPPGDGGATLRFRTRASQVITTMIQENANAGSRTKPKEKTIIGGC